MVLFPLVVKKGSDMGEGDEEIVVCPAQVLVAREGSGKTLREGRRVVRVISGDRMSIDQATMGGRSAHGSAMDLGNLR